MLFDPRALFSAAIFLMAFSCFSEALEFYPTLSEDQYVAIFSCINEARSKEVIDQLIECPIVPNVKQLIIFCNRYLVPDACDVYEQHDKMIGRKDILVGIHQCVCDRLCSLNDDEIILMMEFEDCIINIAHSLKCTVPPKYPEIPYIPVKPVFPAEPFSPGVPVGSAAASSRIQDFPAIPFYPPPE